MKELDEDKSGSINKTELQTVGVARIEKEDKHLVSIEEKSLSTEKKSGAPHSPGSSGETHGKIPERKSGEPSNRGILKPRPGETAAAQTTRIEKTMEKELE